MYASRVKTRKNKLSTLVFSVATLLLFTSINQAFANLLITPTRVEFSERDRSAKVSLVNTSNEIKTYKIYWREQYQQQDGQYVPFKAGERDFPSANRMLRYSPRQVTLKPGERQHVRLGLRRPKDLAAGEFRSHLVFDAQPNKAQLAKKENSGGIKLHLNLSFSIPIIVREGLIDTQSSVGKVDLVTRERDGKVYTGAYIDMNRAGKFSTFGNVKVFWKDNGNQKERIIGVQNNIAIYPELAMRRLLIGFKDHPKKSGIMRIIYEGDGEYKGQVFAEKTLQINELNYRREENYK